MYARGSRTPGFTLIELLIVIAILAVLIGGIAMATSAMLRATRGKNTEETIKATFMLLDSRWKEVREEAAKDQIPAAVASLAGNNSLRAKQLWIKIRLKEAFPVSYAEISNCYGDPLTSLIPTNARRYNSSYKLAMNKRNAAITSSWEAQSAACLILALTSSRSGPASESDALGLAWRDTDGDYLKEVVDGWGRPIAFYRFPTGADIQAANPSPGSSSNPLYDASWTGKTIFESNIHKLTVGGQPAFTIPVLMSAGADGRHGMTANTVSPHDNFSAATLNDIQDNLLSFKLGLGP
jgi:prepilin-type N-terminal cleavage/methylation domain-containing protein